MEAPKLTKVIRLDSLPLAQTHFTPEGYLDDRPILTSTGIFEYRNADGSVRRELRLPEDVFDPESLKSYKGKPIIITHDAGLVNKDNVLDNQIGTILTEGYQDGDDVRAEIMIHGTDEMKECGLRELSLGYNLDLDETPGVWNGKPYDAIQRNIRVNHLALVRNARAGDQARLNIDSRDSKTILKGGKAMSKTQTTQNTARRADGALSEEELAKAIEEYKARHAQPEVADGEGETAEPVKTSEHATVPASEGTETEKTDATPVEEGAKADPAVENEAFVPDTDLAKKDEEIADLETALKKIAELQAIIDKMNAEKDFANTEENGVAKDEEAAAPAVSKAAEDGCGENTDGCKTDCGTATMNADSVDELVRTRVQIGMIGRTLNLDGLELMPLGKAKEAIIGAVRPGLRLDGKSDSYREAVFALCVEDAKKASEKNISYQKKQMFNKEVRSDSAESEKSASARREQMIKRMNKEDK